MILYVKYGTQLESPSPIRQYDRSAIYEHAHECLLSIGTSGPPLGVRSSQNVSRHTSIQSHNSVETWNESSTHPIKDNLPFFSGSSSMLDSQALNGSSDFRRTRVASQVKFPSSKDAPASRLKKDAWTLPRHMSAGVCALAEPTKFPHKPCNCILVCTGLCPSDLAPNAHTQVCR